MLILKSKKFVHALLLSAAVTLTLAAPLAAAAYPEKAVDLTIVHSPGGALDMSMRSLARAAEEDLGQKIIVHNFAGGGGLNGAARIATSGTDGYNLGAVVSNTLIFLPQRNKAPYLPLRDFEPIISFGQAAPILIGPASEKGWPGIDDFLQATRNQPGELRIGVPGLGTPSHIALAMISHEHPELSWRFVPFAGPGEAEAALLGGHIDAAASGALPRIRQGQFTPLMVLASSRLGALPDVPSLIDKGFSDPGQGDSVFMLLAPAGTPEAILNTLEGVFLEAAASEEFLQTVQGFSVSPLLRGRAESKLALREAWERERGILRLMGLNETPATQPE